MSPNDADGIANSVDPDLWSGSALFAQAYLPENLGSLRYHKTPKNSDTRKMALLILKFKQCGSTIVSCIQKMQTELQTV